MLPDIFSTQQSLRLSDQLQHELTKPKNPPLHCALRRINDFLLTLDGTVNDWLSELFRLPDYVARANLRVFLNITGRFASGLRALTEVNVQTVRKMVEESSTLLNAGDEAGAGDVLGWQSIMFAQFPQKAASYG
ncbi:MULTISPECIES: hypothetical protein [Caballeronia]|uniref:Uncharacterized protein n=1 Tax=Caballeronia jiangsuensis TaxID=1458357 RepID=A0ABW9CXW6_9BURK|nr:hypothetical protein [Caballeronia sp. GaOx3]